jgi:phenylalanyl-tRNA synthetase beta chain
MNLIYGKKKVQSPDLNPSPVKLDLDYVNKRLGLKLSEKDAVKLLARMGYGYKNKRVLIPAYRTDILHGIDLVEDIAIAYGYENFREEIPNVATVGAESESENFRNKISNILASYGLLEVNTYNLTSKSNQVDKMQCGVDVVELANALNEDYNVLRAWLVPSFLEILKNNKHNEYPQEIFGSGTVFKKDINSDTGVSENKRICCMLSSPKVNFTSIKQILDGLFSAIDVKYEIRPVEHNSFILGRVGRVSVNGKDIAYIGEINPEVLHNFELENPVACFELNVSELLEVLK